MYGRKVCTGERDNKANGGRESDFFFGHNHRVNGLHSQISRPAITSISAEKNPCFACTLLVYTRSCSGNLQFHILFG